MTGDTNRRGARVMMRSLCGVCMIIWLAFTAEAHAQHVTVDCDDDCYVTPHFHGEGGLIGQRAVPDDPDTADRDEGAVTFVVRCGASTTGGTAETDEDGIVRMLLSFENGLACEKDAAEVLISNLKPGGWYWINEGVNSAVASLVLKGAVGGRTVDLVDPGGVVLTKSHNGAATFVRHEPTGRVGILSNLELSVSNPPCAGLHFPSHGACTLGSPDDWNVGLGLPPQTTVRMKRGPKPLEVSVFLPSYAGFVLRNPENPLTGLPDPDAIQAALSGVVTASAELTSPSYVGMRPPEGVGFVLGEFAPDPTADPVLGEATPSFVLATLGAFGTAVAYQWLVGAPVTEPEDPNDPTGRQVVVERCRWDNPHRTTPDEMRVTITLAPKEPAEIWPPPPTEKITRSFSIVCPDE